MNGGAVREWLPARRHPETYPGNCPGNSYAILDQQVVPLRFAGQGELDSAYVVLEDERVPLDALLVERGLPRLAERFPSLAYGANRNPATLAIKMANYHYLSSGEGLVLPVLKGVLTAQDVVACGLSGQGYLYAGLTLADGPGHDSAIDAWVPLLDQDQLRVMHDGENVRNGLYGVAEIPVTIEGFAQEVPALGYVGDDEVFVSPALGKPIAYSTIRASRRTYPSMTAVEMIDHLLGIGDLRPTLEGVVGPRLGSFTALELMHFMNERWWIRFLGHPQPDDRYDALLGAMTAVVSRHRRPTGTAAALRRRGSLLDVDDAYTPGPARMLGAVLAG